MVDDNSDTFVHQYLKSDISEELISSNRKKENPLPWNKLMDEAIIMLQTQSKKSLDDIKDAMVSLPFDKEMLNVIKKVASYGPKVQTHIVSDSNTFFIGSFLEGLKISHLFNGVITNPTFIDEDTKMLRILPFHKDHSCELCPKNLCKSDAVNDIIKKVVGNEHIDRENLKIIYVG